jgi:uncharacterized protein with GYD domain
MARYVVLIRFTDQGARNLKQSPTRARAFVQAAEKAGIKVENQLWTVGTWDGVAVLSGDQKQVLRTVADLASQGNVRTETLQAFDAAEFAAITG